MSAQRPLELILSRNLLSSLSTPGLLVGEGGKLLFFNEAAGAFLGRSFEDATGLDADQWTAEFGPLNPSGDPIPYEDIPATEALRQRVPFHGQFAINASGQHRPIEVTAIPIVAPDESTAAMVLFWPTDGKPIHAHPAHLADHLDDNGGTV
ncbi:MAG: PAS domain-containing protein [Solirubrobacterales bacterium]|nr:PAS domain-containing protein [Solirubrobacterales bacterium]